MPTRGYGGGMRPPYGTGSWGPPIPSGSVTSGSPISPSNSTTSSSLLTSTTGSFSSNGTVSKTSTALVGYSGLPRTGTKSTSSTEGSPVTQSRSTSTVSVTQTLTFTNSSSPSDSISPATNTTSYPGKPTGYSLPPYGYFPVPSDGSSSSTEVDPATGSSSPAWPIPCNSTNPPNTAPTAPLTTGKTITVPLTLTRTLTTSASRSNSTLGSPATASNITSSLGTSPPSSMPSGPSGYFPMPYPFPPFPISGSSLTGTGSASKTTPIAPVTGTNSTWSRPCSTGISSSPTVSHNATLPPATAPTGGSTSSTEGSPITPSSNSTSSTPIITSTGRITITRNITVTVTDPNTFTKTLIPTGGPAPYPNPPLSTAASSSASSEGDPASPSSNSTTSFPGTFTPPAPYPPYTPSSSVDDPESFTTSPFTTFTVTPHTSSPTATNTPFAPTSAARVPGGYGPPPGYGDGAFRAEQEGRGWFGRWGGGW